METYVFDNPHAYRGFFISKFADLEMDINTFLSLYFIPDPNQVEELVGIIIDRLTFESKRTAYKALLEKIETKNGFIKTKNNKYAYSGLLDEIRKLNEIRVQFAHYWMTWMRTEIDGKIVDDDKSVICLVEFRNSSTIWAYTQSQFDEIINRVDLASAKIGETYKYLNVKE